MWVLLLLNSLTALTLNLRLFDSFSKQEADSAGSGSFKAGGSSCASGKGSCSCGCGCNGQTELRLIVSVCGGFRTTFTGFESRAFLNFFLCPLRKTGACSVRELYENVVLLTLLRSYKTRFFLLSLFARSVGSR